MVQLPEAITLENEASRCKGKWPSSAVTAAIFVSVSLLSCFGRDHGNGGPASRYDDQDGEFPEAAWTQERFDWRWQSCDPRKGKFSLYALEVEPERTCVLSHFSHVQLFATPWTTAHQAPLSLGFSRPEYWSGLPHPPPGDLPDPGIKPVSLMSPALAARLFTTSATWQTPRKTCSDLHWSLLNMDTPKLKFWSGFLPQTGRQLGKMPWILQWQFRNFGSEEDKWILQPHILLFLLIGWYAYILFPHHILRGFEIAC